MPHLPGTADEIRARVPAALDAYVFTRDNVLRDGLVDEELKRLCFRSLAEDLGLVLRGEIERAHDLRGPLHSHSERIVRP